MQPGRSAGRPGVGPVGAGVPLVVARCPPLVVRAAGGLVGVPHEAEALARERRHLELAVTVRVADAGRREDPAARELGPARALDPGHVEVAQVVQAGADDHLVAGGVGHVRDRRARQQLEVLDRLREGRQRRAGLRRSRPARRGCRAGSGRLATPRFTSWLSVTPPLMISGPATPSMFAAIGFSNRLSTLDLSTCSPPAGSESYCAAFDAVAVGRRDVAARDVADRLQLGIAVDVGEDVVDARADERQRVGHDAVRRGRPARQGVAVAVDRVHATAAAQHVREEVREDVREAAGRAAAGSRGRGRVVVELLRRGDDVDLARRR